MMLVDGMLTSNLPVDTARAMGADIVIAVNVGTPLLKREQLNGIMGITGQMLSILTEQNVQASLASLKPTDVLISPELGDYTTGDFDNLPKISPLGEEAARKMGERLSQLSLPPAEYAALRKRQQARVESGRRSPHRGIAQRQPRHRARRDGHRSRTAHRSEEARCRHAAHLRHRRLRARELQLS
jgi:NTE family protein